MIKVAETAEDQKTIALRLDGKVVDVWVPNLEKLCLCYKDERNKTVVLDFSGVIFTNKEGVGMLENIKDERVKITNCSPFIVELLGDLIMK
jgi:anti-anti-sigma regulatory factor